MVTSGEYRGDNSQQTYQLNFTYDVFANRYQYQSQNSGNPSSLNQKWVEATDIEKTTNRFTSGVSYDAAGNVTADPRFRNLEYQYDANGRMKQSSQPNGVNPVKAIFDGGGQRVATKFNGALAIMVYDAMGKLVVEYGQTALATASIQYIMADHQGSTRLVTSRSGAVYSRHDYQPFGEELNAGLGMRTMDQKFNTQDNVRQKYTGMETDDATGMAHTLWRKYDGQSGRWTSPDPYSGSMTTADPQSFNRYTYVNNDPINRVDPSGLISVSPDDPEDDDLFADPIAKFRWHLVMFRGHLDEPHHESYSAPSDDEDGVDSDEPLSDANEVTINDISILEGTIPDNAVGDGGETVVNGNGTSSVLPHGFIISVEYTLTKGGKPVSGARIFETYSVESEQITREAGTGKLVIDPRSGSIDKPTLVSKKRTGKNGKFTDAPLGERSNTPYTSITIRQTLYSVKKGVRQELVTNTITATFNWRIEGGRLRGNGTGSVTFTSRGFTRTLPLPAPTRGIS